MFVYTESITRSINRFSAKSWKNEVRRFFHAYFIDHRVSIQGDFFLQELDKGLKGILWNVDSKWDYYGLLRCRVSLNDLALCWDSNNTVTASVWINSTGYKLAVNWLCFQAHYQFTWRYVPTALFFCCFPLLLAATRSSTANWALYLDGLCPWPRTPTIEYFLYCCFRSSLVYRLNCWPFWLWPTIPYDVPSNSSWRFEAISQTQFQLWNWDESLSLKNITFHFFFLFSCLAGGDSLSWHSLPLA